MHTCNAALKSKNKNNQKNSNNVLEIFIGMFFFIILNPFRNCFIAV